MAKVASYVGPPRAINNHRALPLHHHRPSRHTSLQLWGQEIERVNVRAHASD